MNKNFVFGSIGAIFLIIIASLVYGAVSPTPMPWSYIYNVHINTSVIDTDVPVSCSVAGQNIFFDGFDTNFSVAKCIEINVSAFNNTELDFQWSDISASSFPAYCSDGNALTGLNSSVPCSPFVKSNANINMSTYNATFKCISWGTNNTMC